MVRFGHKVVKAPDSNRRQSDLFQIYDVDQKFRISDIISQLINGSVDVAKDDWISQIQGNKEAISTLLLLNQAGVPIEEAIYFLSIDAIQDYNNEIRLTKSKFAEPLNTAARYGEGSKIISKIRALRNLRKKMAAAGTAKYREEIALIDNFFAERDKLEEDAVQMGQRPETFNKTLERLIENVLFIGDKRINTVFTNNPSLHKKVSTVDLFDTLSGAGNKPLANEFKALLHYFELEKPTDAITTLKNNLNFDTTKSSSTYEAYNKRESIINLRAKGEDSLGYDPEFINKILTDSPIRSFYIQDLQIALMNGLFPTQTSNALLDELRSRIESGEGRDSTEIQRIVSRLFGDKEAYAKKFVEDFPTYLIQRMLKDFDMTSFKAGSYRGFEVSEVVKTDIQEAAVLLKDGKLYFSEAVLEDEYNKTFLQFRKYKESVNYHFRSDCSLLNDRFISDGISFNDGFVSHNGQHPRVLRLLIQRKISYQTAVVLDHFLGFVKNWDKEITEKIVWPEISLKVARVKPFVNVNATECKLIMKEVFVNG